jgi:HlyD family secretion protein
MDSPKPTLDDLRIERSAKREHRPKNRMTAIVVVAVLVVLGILLWWFTRGKTLEVRTVVAREVATSGSERTVLNASGYVTARRAATVSSKVTGKVIEVLVEEGMRVKEGQILARLDDTNIKSSLQIAEAQRESATAALDEIRAQLKQAELEFRRATDLAKQKIASQSELDRTESEANTLKARLERLQRDVTVAERTVASWQQQLDDTIIRAPFAGIVTMKNAQPGEMISPMSVGGFTRTGICTIVDMDSLEVEIDVNESYINRVAAGQPVEATLDAYSDWKIPCKVIAIIPTADRQKSTVKVRVGFDKIDPRILPEMGVKVAFRETGGGVSASRLVIVPKVAVRNQDGRDVVFVVQNGKAERRAVAISSTLDNEATVTAGVLAGEKVIVESPPGLVDGAAVKEKKL